METEKLEGLIAERIQVFYDKRLKKLEELKLKNYLRRKNPYLFRATGTQKAAGVVEEIMLAYMSSSDETMFGTCFFEPIAHSASSGVVSDAEGVDVVIETPTRYLAISVKSGPNPFNASQKKRQNDEFMALRSRLRKLNKQFDALLGHCYGTRRAEPTRKQIYRELSGQEFWATVTGDSDFYLKLIRLMQDLPEQHRPRYKKAWAAAVNRLTREFIADFCHDDGTIDWEKLAAFNSGVRSEPRARKKE